MALVRFPAPTDIKSEIAARPRFEIIDADAIFADLEPPDWLVDGIIVRGSITEIIAYGYSGKSWLAVDLVNSVAAGVPWLERFPTVQGSARFLDYESGRYECRRRLKLDALGRDLATPIAGVSLLTMPALYFTEPDFPSEIERLCEGQACLVVDTLKAGSPKVEENSSEIRVGIDHARRAGERQNCSVVLLAHAKKITGNPQKIDPREVGRGSSAIFDAADSVLLVTYTEGEPLRVQQTKARSGKAVEPFNVEIIDTPNGGVRVTASDIPEADRFPGAADFDKNCDLVLAAIRTNPGASQVVITEKAKKRPTTVKAALEMLERNGAIKNAGTGKAGRWFAS